MTAYFLSLDLQKNNLKKCLTLCTQQMVYFTQVSHVTGSWKDRETLDRSHLSRKVISSLFIKDKLFNKMTHALISLSKKSFGNVFIMGEYF